jgi:hypothetical protein
MSEKRIADVMERQKTNIVKDALIGGLLALGMASSVVLLVQAFTQA